MPDPRLSKSSTARRRGDDYELYLLALKCLEMVKDPQVLRVFHEYRPALPADDVVVESIHGVDCYQAKHASDPHALLEFGNLTDADSKLGLNIQRLKSAWNSLRTSDKEVWLHIYTNRAADHNLAKILDGSRISPEVVAGTAQKRLRVQLKEASGIAQEHEFKSFLNSLRFDLCKEDLSLLQEYIQRDWLERRLSLNGRKAFVNLIYHVREWFLERHSRPIEKSEVLQALNISGATLPQRFPVDPRTYVSRPGFKRQIDELHLRAATDIAKEREDERAALLCTYLGICLQMVGEYQERALI